MQRRGRSSFAEPRLGRQFIVAPCPPCAEFLPPGALGCTILKVFPVCDAGWTFCWHSRSAAPDRLEHVALACGDVSFEPAHPASAAMATGSIRNFIIFLVPCRVSES